MKTFKFSLVLRTRENTDVFISLDDNIYGIHSKRVNILYLFIFILFFQKSCWNRHRSWSQSTARIYTDSSVCYSHTYIDICS